MSLQADTIEFFDEDAKQHGVIIVRTHSNQIGLCISLEENGDIEVFLSPSDAQSVLDALKQAIGQAKDMPS